MKEKLHFTIEAVLIIAVIILFAFQFSGDKKSSTDNTSQAKSETTSGDVMALAYIDVESLLANYTYSIELNEQIAKKIENLRVDMTERGRKLEVEVNDFSRKVEANAFLSQERFDSERNRLAAKHEELREYEARKTQELSQEQITLSERLNRNIISKLRDYNKDKKFHIIYGKINDNILYADDAYNITEDVIEYLNKQRASSPDSDE